MINCKFTFKPLFSLLNIPPMTCQFFLFCPYQSDCFSRNILGRYFMVQSIIALVISFGSIRRFIKWCWQLWPQLNNCTRTQRWQCCVKKLKVSLFQNRKLLFFIKTDPTIWQTYRKNMLAIKPLQWAVAEKVCIKSFFEGGV